MPSSAEVGAWDSRQECGLGSMGPQTGETRPALALGTGAIFGGHHEGFHGLALLHTQACRGGGGWQTMGSRLGEGFTLS